LEILNIPQARPARTQLPRSIDASACGIGSDGRSVTHQVGLQLIGLGQGL
jgi:hypothetical protein